MGTIRIGVRCGGVCGGCIIWTDMVLYWFEDLVMILGSFVRGIVGEGFCPD